MNPPKKCLTNYSSQILLILNQIKFTKKNFSKNPPKIIQTLFFSNFIWHIMRKIMNRIFFKPSLPKKYPHAPKIWNFVLSKILIPQTKFFQNCLIFNYFLILYLIWIFKEKYFEFFIQPQQAGYSFHKWHEGDGALHGKLGTSFFYI